MKKSARSTPRSQRKAQKKPRSLLASSGLEIMKGCQQITNRSLWSIRRSPLRGLKRLRKLLVPGELKVAASSRCSLPRSERSGRRQGHTSDRYFWQEAANMLRGRHNMEERPPPTSRSRGRTRKGSGRKMGSVAARPERHRNPERPVYCQSRDGKDHHTDHDHDHLAGLRQ